ncbi:MAG: hypothetical protein WC812_01625 [Candidatus Pacearchaeota archaeon]|jgi:diaminopimelate decarboxylase
MKKTKSGYILEEVNLENLAREHGTPLFVMSKSQILNRINKMKNAFSYPNILFLYANKANRLISIQELLIQNGIGIQAGSIGEMYLGLKSKCFPQNMRTTQNGQDEEFLKFAINKKIKPYLDSFEDIDRLHFLIKNSEVSKNFPIGIRINPGDGDGEDPHHTITSGPESEFGIYYTQTESIFKKIKDLKINLDSLEMHIGSNYKYPGKYLRCFDTLLNLSLDFEKNGIAINEISGGGGKGISYNPNAKDLDIKSFGKEIDEKMFEYSKKVNKKPLLIFEDGRWYVGDGLLLTKVMSIKKNPDQRPQIIVDSGIPQLIRIVMYNAEHHFHNITKHSGINKHIIIKGNDCEHVELSKDSFIGKPEVNDIIGVRNATAYTVASMENEYGGRLNSKVALLDKGKVKVIREKGKLEDLSRNEIY